MMNNDSTIKIATTTYALDQLPDFSAYQNKIEKLVKSAKDQNADLLLLPEYAGMDLTNWNSNNLLEQFNHIQTSLDHYIELFRTLAKQYQMYIQPGSLPVKNDQNGFHNRAYLFSPNGNYAFQNKIQLTQFELEAKLIISGNSLQIFQTAIGPIAIAICYDSEFPSLVHQLVNAGANLILVPACNDSLWGYHRVHFSCRARALENQCYVAESHLVGNNVENDFVDINVGAAGLFSPIDHGFPNDGVIALGPLNEVQIIVGELNYALLELVRAQGQVRNFQDMQYYQNSLYKNIVIDSQEL